MRYGLSKPEPPYVLHPFFLALVFILNSIRNKLIFAPPAFQDVVVFVPVILIVALVTYYLVLLFLFNEKLKAGIFTSILIFFMLWYFDIFNALFSIPALKQIIMVRLFQKFHVVLLSALILFCFLVYLFFKRTSFKCLLLNRYLNIVFFLFVLIEVYRISFEKQFEVELQNKVNVQDIHFQKGQDPERDVYFIVMDCYTSSASLKKYWNYDNNGFEENLRSKGFFIADNSHANYNSTPFSISSALNMSCLNLANYDQAQNVQMSKIYDLVKNSAAVKVFAGNGYKIINYSLFDLLNTKAFYEDPFYHRTNLFDRTVFFFITERLHITHEHQSLMDLGDLNMEIVSMLNSRHEKNTPAFYYIHLMMPHFPYFFNENGVKMPLAYVLSDEQDKEKYLQQLKYTNHVITKLVDHILAGPGMQPIIIIQGDHGFRELYDLGFDEQLKESKTIFNAYLFPGTDTGINMISDSISPVNSFRMLFNNYFGAKLPLLDNKFCNTQIKRKYRRNKGRY